MNHVLWNDNLNLGVDFIDKEHQVLFSTMNKLLKISEAKEKSEFACREGVKFLKNHTTEHFEHEEEYMRSIDYVDYEIHKRLHDDFRFGTLPALEREMVEANYSEESLRHFLGVCIGWVVSHTQTEDLAIVGKVMSKWANLPHEKEKDALEQTIIQLIQDIFHLKAKLLSEQYAGENFGKKICCRLIYRSKKKEKWEITLIFEESILLNIVSGILNSEYQKVDDMVINIARYLARQFIERISESFPSIDLYEVEKEALLTQEQLTKSFERAQPPCSLLFSTEAGYFAFCAATYDSDQSKIKFTIDHSSAMQTIREYLAKEDVVPKKKVLVVDDSEFMRTRIKQLLSENYEVIEADSSITAIKNLAINRPDLILLDYEMPVCNGRQALEMIRSDKETANIPVMFLTGRRDRESVQKVMELKPERYLLKTMPDADIKKSVDNFFSK